jgi:hypothetical protein
MPKPAKPAPAASSWDSEVRFLAWLGTCVSVMAFLFYFRRGEVMLYGDAIAHINIARRVFDSKTPGLLQLGTVWLPLPHLLMIPFLISNQMWIRGVGGSIPSMAAYVFGVIGIFRLTRRALARGAVPDPAAHVAAWSAALIYAANPNLIYMQSTAMGESLYLALFLWSVLYFSEFAQGDSKALTKCGLCLTAASLTRYDGWFLAAAMAAVVAVAQWRAHKNLRQGGRAALQGRVGGRERRASAPGAAVIKFVLIAAAAPALWLAYNAIVYRNPLEFADGPYSARAIERKTQAAGNPGHPGTGNPVLAEMYFVKSAEANVAHNQWLQRLWIVLSLAAITGAVWVFRRTSGPVNSGPLSLLFLLIPLPFYALSIAYSGIPIFIPYWWPFTHYNVRYGLQLLPAAAVSWAILVYLIVRAERWNRRTRLACVLAVFAFVALSYANVWRAVPICLQEAQTNMRTRNQFQAELALWLEKLPPDSTLLMYLGDHVGALERAGIPLKRTINEGNHRVWKQPADPEGLWERALANPSQYADFVLAFEGDPVWHAVHDLHLTEVVEIHVTGQSRGVLYRAR